MSLLEGCLPSVPDIISYGAAVSACEKEGRWEEAVYLLSRLPQVRIAGDVSFYNAVISASEKGSRWQMALQLLPMISVLRLEADVVSYSSAISACQKCDEWRVAAVAAIGDGDDPCQGRHNRLQFSNLGMQLVESTRGSEHHAVLRCAKHNYHLRFNHKLC